MSEADYCPLTGDQPVACDVCLRRPGSWVAPSCLDCTAERVCTVCFSLWWRRGYKDARRIREESIALLR